MRKLLFCAQDPGGANAILPLYHPLAGKGYPIVSLLGGPARDIWRGHGLNFIDGDSTGRGRVESILSAESWSLCLSGTSVGDSVDRIALPLVKRSGAAAISVLDFWNNYWQRFSGKSKDFAFLPDSICVMDEIARSEMISEGFDPARLVVTGNPHFDHFADTVTRTDEDPRAILFISQPLSDHACESHLWSYGYDEFSVLRQIAEVAKLVAREHKILVRLHPKEKPDKYDGLLAMHDNLSLSKSPTLEDALSRSALVIGMFSPVLLQAAVAGKPTLSYQPCLASRDPLVTNRSGLTERISNLDTLRKRLNEHATEGIRPKAFRWPQNATGEVASIIECMLAKRISP